MKNFKRFIGVTLIAIFLLSISGCNGRASHLIKVKGDIAGNEYIIDTFDNNGNLTLKTHGEKIAVAPNIAIERVYSSDGGWTNTEVESSILTITIDGSEIETCGDTCIFYDKSLEPDYDFSLDSIDSSFNNSILDSPFISKSVNKIKNEFGKSRVVIIKSQLGVPIYAFSGNDIYWELEEDLPKFTRILVDGKPLYIHRANFQIIDTELIDDIKE